MIPEPVTKHESFLWDIFVFNNGYSNCPDLASDKAQASSDIF